MIHGDRTDLTYIVDSFITRLVLIGALVSAVSSSPAFAQSSVKLGPGSVLEIDVIPPTDTTVTAAILKSATFKAYVDGVAMPATGVACVSGAAAAIFTCTAGMPKAAQTPGEHTIAFSISTFVDGEWPKGPPLTFTYVAPKTGIVPSVPRLKGSKPPIASASNYFLSDLTPESSTNGWGPYEKDRSNGEQASGDGKALTLNGVTFAKGLGVHAVSNLQYRLGGKCSTFTATIGVDDEVGINGSLTFQVYIDGGKLYDSGPMAGDTASKPITVDVTGTKVLRLAVVDAGATFAFEHADWANAIVRCTEKPPTPVVVVPVGAAINPGENVQAKIDAAPEGTSFVLKAGVHRLPQSLRSKNRMVFSGEAGAILTGGRVLTGWVKDGTLWYVGGQTQQGARNADGSCLSGYPRCAYPEDVFVNNVQLRHVGSRAEVSAGRYFFDYDADRIYIADDPAGKVVETSVTDAGFIVSGVAVTIQGLILEHFASPAQNGAINASGSSNWIIQDNEVRSNHGVGVRIGDDTKLLRNNIHHNGQIGVGGGGNRALVEGNLIDDNNVSQYDWAWEAGGAKWAGTTGLIVRGNTARRNGGPGLWTDIDNLNTTYDGNTVEDNLWAGIFHEISCNAVIKNNIARRNGFGHADWIWGAGILVAASRDVEVFGNILEGNADGITAVQQNRDGHDPGGACGTTNNNKLMNVWVHDNTSVNSGSTGLAQDVRDDGIYTNRNIRFERNTYTGGSFFWMNSDRNAAQWKGYGQDVSGVFK